MTVMKKVCLCCLVSLFIVSCQKKREAPAPEETMLAPAPAAEVTSVDAASGQMPIPVGESSDQQGAASLPSALFAQKAEGHAFVFSANVNFSAKNVYDSVVKIENMVIELGGFVQKSDIHSSISDAYEYPQGNQTMIRVARYNREASMVVRLPANKTQDFLHKLGEDVQFLSSREFEAIDVQIDRLRQKLQQKRAAQAASDFSEAERQQQGENQIDAMQRKHEARNNQDAAMLEQALLNDQIAYSTIRLSFSQPEGVFKEIVPDLEAIKKEVRPAFWPAFSMALADGWYGFLALITALSHLWVLVLLSLLGAATVMIVKKRQKQKEPANSSEPLEKSEQA